MSDDPGDPGGRVQESRHLLFLQPEVEVHLIAVMIAMHALVRVRVYAVVPWNADVVQYSAQVLDDNPSPDRHETID
jgi:hypothetical protein